jgi:anti-sigma B factor antagonist
MNIVLRVTEADPAVVLVAGEIDIFTAPTLRRILFDLVAAGSAHLVLDLDGVDFIDSAGLNVLVAVLNQTRGRSGSLRLVCSHPRVVRMLRIAGPPKDLPVHPRLEDALLARTQRGEPA